MSEEKLSIADVVLEAEAYLQTNYPVDSTKVETVLNILRKDQKLRFWGREDLAIATWAVIAGEMADSGYDYRFGVNENKPESDLATYITAIAKFGIEFSHEQAESDWTSWKLKILTRAELTNARNYLGSMNAKPEDVPNFMEKAGKLYGLYQRVEVASDI